MSTTNESVFLAWLTLLLSNGKLFGAVNVWGRCLPSKSCRIPNHTRMYSTRFRIISTVGRSWFGTSPRGGRKFMPTPARKNLLFQRATNHFCCARSPGISVCGGRSFRQRGVIVFLVVGIFLLPCLCKELASRVARPAVLYYRETTAYSPAPRPADSAHPRPGSGKFPSAKLPSRNSTSFSPSTSTCFARLPHPARHVEYLESTLARRGRKYLHRHGVLHGVGVGFQRELQG